MKLTNLNKMIAVGTLAVVIGVTPMASFASDFGSAGVVDGKTYTNEQMLKYAIEDEYMAQAEYDAIMKEYGVQKPFSNIIKSEQRHIDILKPLFEKYGIALPENTAAANTIVPDSVESALKIGVEAEVNNIAMYDKFLAGELPSDLREAFEYLRDASENHQSAFERGVERGADGSSRLGAKDTANGAGRNGGNLGNGKSDNANASKSLSTNGVGQGAKFGQASGQGQGLGNGAGQGQGKTQGLGNGAGTGSNAGTRGMGARNGGGLGNGTGLGAGSGLGAGYASDNCIYQ